MKLLAGLFLTFLLAIPVFAQNIHSTERCLTHVKEAEKLKKTGSSQADFENWLSAKIVENQGRKTTNSYKVPVVFHIVHFGDEAGQGNNIRAEQVASQLQVLNEDFQRTNTDAANTIPVFQSVAAGFDLEFQLAKIDPDGNPLQEEGIHRYFYETSSTSLNDFTIDNEIKPNSIWDPFLYLNIWVVPMGDGSAPNTLLGYATFPGQSGLLGMPADPEPYELDGVVVNTSAFGSNYTGHGSFEVQAAFDRGRTTTHEVGHFFGLRHIWGDGGCSVDDYCQDTPAQGSPHQSDSCPLDRNTCGGVNPDDLPDMIQNFMDYSNDICMNLFTHDQVDRMEAVLQNSPRRRELLISYVALDPDPEAVYAFFSVNQSRICQGSSVIFTDESYIGNEASITQYQWDFDVNNQGGVSEKTQDSSGPHEIIFSNPGTYQVSLTVTGLNGSSNQFALSLLVEGTDAEENTPLPLTSGFEGGQNSNSDWQPGLEGIPNWDFATVGNNSASSLVFDNFSEDFRGVPGLTILPSFYELTEGTSELYFSFDYAYAPYGNSNSTADYDSLVIVYSTDCNFNFLPITGLTKEELRTANAKNSLFIPTASDWKSKTIQLSDFLDLTAIERITIGFLNEANYGNAIYIDNVSLREESSGALQVINPIPDLITIAGTTEPIAVPLSTVFSDPDDPEAVFTYSVTDAGNTELNQSEIANGELVLTFPSGFTGTNRLVVRATGNGKKGQDIFEINILENGATPAIPGNLQVATQTSGLLIQWQDLSNFEEGFTLERSVNGGEFEEIARLQSNSNSFVDTDFGDLAACSKLAYRARSFYQEVYSEYSNLGIYSFETSITPLNPSYKDFEDGLLPLGWAFRNNELGGWEITSIGSNGSSKSLSIDNFNINMTDREDALIELEIFKKNDMESLSLSFDIAYAAYQDLSGQSRFDNLDLRYAESCNGPYSSFLFLEGEDLVTAPATDTYFLPSPAQWKTMYFDLSDLLELPGENLRIAIANVGEFNQPFYLDNIILSDQPKYVLNLPEEIRQQVKLFPNPSEGNIHIVLPEEIREHTEVEVWTSTGRKLSNGLSLAKTTGQNIQLTLPQQPGLYLIKLKSKLGASFFKVVKI